MNDNVQYYKELIEYREYQKKILNLHKDRIKILNNELFDLQNYKLFQGPYEINNSICKLIDDLKKYCLINNQQNEYLLQIKQCTDNEIEQEKCKYFNYLSEIETKKNLIYIIGFILSYNKINYLELLIQDYLNDNF